jgi:hypothetical protein
MYAHYAPLNACLRVPAADLNVGTLKSSRLPSTVFYLPAPLYALYQQAVAYRDAFDGELEVEVRCAVDLDGMAAIAFVALTACSEPASVAAACSGLDSAQACHAGFEAGTGPDVASCFSMLLG